MLRGLPGVDRPAVASRGRVQDQVRLDDQSWVRTINQIPYQSTMEVPSGRVRRTHPGNVFNWLSDPVPGTLRHNV